MPELSSGYAGGSLITASSFSGANSLGSATITASATPGTKGTATELIASTAHDANWIAVGLTGAASSSVGLLDILIGAATEQVIVPDLFYVARGSTASAGSYLVPIFIPKGSRISARVQSATVSGSIVVTIHLIGGSLIGGGQAAPAVSGYGATASSLGTNIDPGGTANTWSAWTEITAATERDHRWLILSGRYGDANGLATSWRVQVGIGAATEQVLVPDIAFSMDATSDLVYNAVHSFPIFIPKGSRLSARVRSSSITDGDRDIWVRLYGAG
jgi:hypothetical protein